MEGAGSKIVAIVPDGSFSSSGFGQSNRRIRFSHPICNSLHFGNPTVHVLVPPTAHRIEASDKGVSSEQKKCWRNLHAFLTSGVGSCMRFE